MSALHPQLRDKYCRSSATFTKRSLNSTRNAINYQTLFYLILHYYQIFSTIIAWYQMIYKDQTGRWNILTWQLIMQSVNLRSDLKRNAACSSLCEWKLSSSVTPSVDCASSLSSRCTSEEQPNARAHSSLLRRQSVSLRPVYMNSTKSRASSRPTPATPMLKLAVCCQNYSVAQPIRALEESIRFTLSTTSQWWHNSAYKRKPWLKTVPNKQSRTLLNPSPLNYATATSLTNRNIFQSESLPCKQRPDHESRL